MSAHAARYILAAAVVIPVVASASPPARMAVTTKACAFFDSPASGLLPRAFLKIGDTCQVDTVFTDTSGVTWCRYTIDATHRWVDGALLRYCAAVDTIPSGSGVRTNDADRKRRYRQTRENPQWPRRIIAAVRAGEICLDMTEEQLSASWGEPFQRGRSFTLGVGEYATWFYRGTDGGILFVNLSAGRVIGWFLRRL